uniref:Uncharacterized protein n=1 Tax=Strongyloides papillosus TaxID=174720 RepID=A0A0N5CGB1_STREA
MIERFPEAGMPIGPSYVAKELRGVWTRIRRWTNYDFLYCGYVDMYNYHIAIKRFLLCTVIRYEIVLSVF